LKDLYAAFGRTHASDALASATDRTSILRTMPDTMSDKGRHALGGNADATWNAFKFGLCTGGICIAFLTQLRTQRDATQLTLHNSTFKPGY
jgi:hypothetical protein